MKIKELREKLRLRARQSEIMTTDYQKSQPIEKPEWLVIYEKLEKMLEPLPFMSVGTKQKIFYSQANPDQESLLITQDYAGYIAAIDYMSRDVLFYAHPKGGASIFIKGEWLDILDEENP